MLFSSINVRRARTHVSDASCASRDSVSSCRVSSSCSLIADSSFFNSSSSDASSVRGRSSGVGLALPKNPDMRRELPDGVDDCALTRCRGSSWALCGGLVMSLWYVPGADTEAIRRCPPEPVATELPVRGTNELRRDDGGPLNDDGPARDRSSVMFEI
jgi:hypothetical protein